MSNTKHPLVEANEANLPEWKEKHKTVKQINVDSKVLKTKVPFIIGKPTAQMLDAIAKYQNDGKPHKVDEILINSCILAGDKQLLNADVDLKNAVLSKITDLLERLEVEEKEL